MRKLFLILFAFAPSLSFGQDWNENTTTVEGIVTEVLALLSTEEQDWEKFRGLFLSSAHFMVVSENDQMGTYMQSFALEDFVRLFQRTTPGTFTETQLKLDVNEYNGIAQAWQTYEVQIGDTENSGINSFQLVYHANRWWIASIVWANNTNGTPIPAAYLPEEKK